MRLFIGIAPDHSTMEALAHTAQALRGAVRGRYVPPDRYHITLAFLGQRHAADLPRIEAAMQSAAASALPFQLRLGALGTFGDTLWRGVETCEALQRLVAALRAALDAAEIPYDRKRFSPHFTLVRHARGEAELQALPGAAFAVSSIILYESVQHDGEIAYMPRFRVPLKG